MFDGVSIQPKLGDLKATSWNGMEATGAWNRFPSFHFIACVYARLLTLFIMGAGDNNPIQDGEAIPAYATE